MPETFGYVVVVVAYRSREPLTGFLDSIGTQVPVLVVNNSMDEDDLADLIDPRPNVTQIDAGGNLGFSAGANAGARATNAEFLVFMNPDTLPKQPELDRMMEFLGESEGVASCGPTGVRTAGGGALPTFPRVFAHVLGLHKVFPTIGLYYYPRRGERLEVGWISGSCLAIRRSDFEDIGGFDERFFVFMSDFDLGRRLVERGRSQVLLADVVIEHFDGGSSRLPSEWAWTQRGKGWGEYINLTMTGFRRLAIAALLVNGFRARRVLYGLLRRGDKATEMGVYLKALRTELRVRY
jgi:GT2 family glycosyltransferase